MGHNAQFYKEMNCKVTVYCVIEQGGLKSPDLKRDQRDHEEMEHIAHERADIYFKDKH